MKKEVKVMDNVKPMSEAGKNRQEFNKLKHTVTESVKTLWLSTAVVAAIISIGKLRECMPQTIFQVKGHHFTVGLLLGFVLFITLFVQWLNRLVEVHKKK